MTDIITVALGSDSNTQDFVWDLEQIDCYFEYHENGYDICIPLAAYQDQQEIIDELASVGGGEIV